MNETPALGFLEVPLEDIRENPAALRQVNKEDEQYSGLVDSIKVRGVLQPILVRKLIDNESGKEYFGLVDGLQRYNGSQDAGRKTIPVRVITGSEYDALETQIIANHNRIDTNPMEYTKALQRLMSANPLMSVSELAQKVSSSPQWINDRLGLLKLAAPIQSLVSDGRIGLNNAYALAKLRDHDEQMAFLERALNEKPDVFVPAIQARVKELNEAKRQGRAAAPPGFSAQPHLQKLGDLKTELENPSIGTVLHDKYFKDTNSSAFLKGWNTAIAWALKMDKDSVETAKTEYELREEQKRLKKQTADKEKAEKQKVDATKKLEEANKVLAGAK